MAIDDAYATALLYRQIILANSSDSTKDPIINDDLKAVSRVIDRKLSGRFFTRDANPVARTYRPKVIGTRTLSIDDVADKTGIVVKVDDNRDGTAETVLTIGTDYELLPRNAGVGPEPEPWNQLYIPERSPRRPWAELVEVTCPWGWPAIPPAIQRATVHIGGILRLDSPRATNRIPEEIANAVEASPAAMRIIDDLVYRYSRPVWSRP